MKKTFKTLGHLANLLQTGTVLTFQFFSPIFTNQGKCNGGDQVFTSALIALSGVLCSVLCFTDSFRDNKGKVRYGLATFKGLWVIDSPVPVKFSPEEAARYRLKFIDFVHAFMSTFYGDWNWVQYAVCDFPYQTPWIWISSFFSLMFFCLSLSIYLLSKIQISIQTPESCLGVDYYLFFFYKEKEKTLNSMYYVISGKLQTKKIINGDVLKWIPLIVFLFLLLQFISCSLST